MGERPTPAELQEIRKIAMAMITASAVATTAGDALEANMALSAEAIRIGRGDLGALLLFNDLARLGSILARRLALSTERELDVVLQELGLSVSAYAEEQAQMHRDHPEVFEQRLAEVQERERLRREREQGPGFE
ncbi:MAG: hypothetical protein ACJ71Y_01210 [Blastococcus sp.]